jgi:uncharacterized protein DUF4160
MGNTSNPRQRAAPCNPVQVGILIYMYYNDHMPPHFHAKWAEYEALILICTSTVPSSFYAGNLPKSQLDLVLRWAASQCEELMDNWELARKGKPLRQIAPLVGR